jgi:hypothetical protein
MLARPFHYGAMPLADAKFHPPLGIVLLFVLFSCLNYGVYDHRLNLIEANAAATAYANCAKETRSVFESLDVDHGLIIRKHKDFVTREVLVAVLCWGGLILVYLANRKYSFRFISERTREQRRGYKGRPIVYSG